MKIDKRLRSYLKQCNEAGTWDHAHIDGQFIVNSDNWAILATAQTKDEAIRMLSVARERADRQ